MAIPSPLPRSLLVERPCGRVFVLCRDTDLSSRHLRSSEVQAVTRQGAVWRLCTNRWFFVLFGLVPTNEAVGEIMKSRGRARYRTNEDVNSGRRARYRTNEDMNSFSTRG